MPLSGSTATPRAGCHGCFSKGIINNNTTNALIVHSTHFNLIPLSCHLQQNVLLQKRNAASVLVLARSGVISSAMSAANHRASLFSELAVVGDVTGWWQQR
jgi:hypothetical protein